MEGAGDGGSAEGEDIYLSPHLLEVFLVGYAKALFLIADSQPLIFEGDVLLQ